MWACVAALQTTWALTSADPRLKIIKPDILVLFRRKHRHTAATSICSDVGPGNVKFGVVSVPYSLPVQYLLAIQPCLELSIFVTASVELRPHADVMPFVGLEALTPLPVLSTANALWLVWVVCIRHL